jgi:3D (Asp-Asp-Asp) domain-containing protein
MLQAGSTGYIMREFKVRLVDGAEASRELLSETVVTPIDEILSIGTYVSADPLDYGPLPPAPSAAVSMPGVGECAQVVNVYATWYTAASAGGNTTATGTGVYKGIVAVDPNFIPLGTRLYIPGYGYGVAADTGGGVRGWFIDLGYGPGDVHDWHSRYLDICILN